MTCDTDAVEVADVVRDWWPRIAAVLVARGKQLPRVLFTCRAHQGEARLNQARNNGLRGLESGGLLWASDLIVVLDGDTMLAPDAVARHRAAIEAGYEFIIPFRVNTSEAIAKQVDSGLMLRQLLDSGDVSETQRLLESQGDTASLASRHLRYERQLWFRRRLPMLTKPHKPKILGGHHAVSVRCLREVNAFDEEYVGYGYDDDDLARRIHTLKPRTRIAVRDTIAYHLWHPTRAPAKPTDAPGYARFARSDLPVKCTRGWTDPRPQPQPSLVEISAEAPSSART